MGTARRLATRTAIGVAALAAVAGASYALLPSRGVTTARDTPAAAAPTSVTPRPTSTPRPTPAPTARTATVAPRPKPEPVLEPGDRGVDVRELQGRLTQLAWFAPPMTGRYDATTRGSVRGFQGKRGFEATGTTD